MARIAFIDLLFHWPPRGGSWVDLKEIAARLGAAGHEVELFVPRFEDYFPRGRVEGDLPFQVHVIPFNRFTFNIHTLAKRLVERLRRFSPDLVYLADGYFMKGALLPRLKPWPVVMRFYAYELVCFNLHHWLYDENRVCDGNFIEDPERCHRCWYKGHLSMPKHALGILAGVEDRHPALHFSQEYMGSLAFTRSYRSQLPQWLGLPRAIIVYNEFMRDLLSRYNSDVRVVPSGVDTKRFSPSSPHEASSGPPRLLMVGRVDDDLKGFSTLKDACDRLASEGIRFRLEITSDAPVGRGIPYLENLGWVGQDELPRIYNRGDISVVPSVWREPFGIAAVESMAAGLPVVASRTGGLETSVVHGETGYLFPPGDSEDLAERLRELLVDPNLRRRFGEAGRRRARDLFDWDIIVEKHYLPLVESMSSQSSGASPN